MTEQKKGILHLVMSEPNLKSIEGLKLKLNADVHKSKGPNLYKRQLSRIRRSFQ